MPILISINLLFMKQGCLLFIYIIAYYISTIFFNIMISTLKGIVSFKSHEHIVLEVNGVDIWYIHIRNLSTIIRLGIILK